MNPYKLLIADGDGLMHMAFHTALGNATKGCDPDILAAMIETAIEQTPEIFSNIIGKAANRVKATHAVIVFDGLGETPRKVRYVDYKAGRPKRLFDTQAMRLTLIDEMAHVGWRSLQIQAQEADDVMASLATRTACAGIETAILSSDRDLWQIIKDPLIYCINPREDYAKIDEAQVYERFGLSVNQYADLKVLMGDKGDNVPGIKSWGLKYSTRYLQEMGCLDDIIRRADELPQKLRDNLVTADLDLCNFLTRLITNIEIPFKSLDELRITSSYTAYDEAA